MTNKEMKNKLTYPLICCIAMMMAACSGLSNGKPMSGDKLTEYNETVTKIQTIENLLADINGMEASDALQLSQLADQLYYTYDSKGLDSRKTNPIDKIIQTNICFYQSVDNKKMNMIKPQYYGKYNFYSI